MSQNKGIPFIAHKNESYQIEITGKMDFSHNMLGMYIQLKILNHKIFARTTANYSNFIGIVNVSDKFFVKFFWCIFAVNEVNVIEATNRNNKCLLDIG